MTQQVFEIWDSPDGGVRYCLSHSDKSITSGALILKSNVELPKHKRQYAVENLLQVAGESTVTLFNEDDTIEEIRTLGPGNAIRLEKGQWHLHANAGEEESVTLFTAEGDVTDYINKIRGMYNQVNPS
jgi:quercetin dioxygenase-like cupin family protein